MLLNNNIRLTLLLLAALLGLVNSKATTGLRWDVREPGGGLMRSLTDGQEILNLEYNSREELVQCWQTEQGRLPDSISLLFYAVSLTR